MAIELVLTPKAVQVSASSSAAGIGRQTAAKMEHSFEFAVADRIEAMRNLTAEERRIMVKTHLEARKTQTGVAPTLQSSVEPPSVATRLDPRSAYAQLCQPSTGAIAALSAGIPQPAEKKKKKVPAELDHLQIWQRRTPWQPAEYLGQLSAAAKAA